MRIIKLGFASLSMAFLLSCGSLQQKVSNNDMVETSINLIDVQNDKINVIINAPTIINEEISYIMPAIVPGTYQISDFGKFVSDFKAFDKLGNELSVQTEGKNTWKIKEAIKLDYISYWVEDTFDTSIENDIYGMSGTNIEEKQNFFLNLHGFIGYFDGNKDLSYSIEIDHPENLYETSSLVSKKVNTTKDKFYASRYSYVTDNPIMYATPNSISFDVDGISVSLAMYSPNAKHNASDFEEPLKKMMQAQSNFLKNFKTTKEYNILVYLYDSKIYSKIRGGALEHNTSTTVVFPEEYTKEQLIATMVNHTISHEFFHIVTPLSVHSEEIHDFNYINPDMSKHLWMYEGATEYFSNLFQVNQDLLTDNEFFNEIAKKINSSLSYDDTMSFTVMSKNILEAPYEKNYINVYQKGALINMCIDIILREESNGEYGVLNLMKDLSQKYGENKPFNDDTIIDEIAEMTNSQVANFLNKYVIEGSAINYETFFNKVGLSLTTVPDDSFYFFDKDYYPYFDKGGNGELVFGKKLSTGLEILEIKPGDVLKSINGVEVNESTMQQLMRETMGWKVGDEIEIAVTRNDIPLYLKGKAIQPQVNSLKITKQNLKSTDSKVILRNAWLKN